MVSNCANPGCAKPLLYLREGRIFVFDVSSGEGAGGKRLRRLEHFWLCGACSRSMVMVQDAQGIRVLRKAVSRERDDSEPRASAMAC